MGGWGPPQVVIVKALGPRPQAHHHAANSPHSIRNVSELLKYRDYITLLRASY